MRGARAKIIRAAAARAMCGVTKGERSIFGARVYRAMKRAWTRRRTL